jgi:hypothetical protein
MIYCYDLVLVSCTQLDATLETFLTILELSQQYDIYSKKISHKSDMIYMPMIYNFSILLNRRKKVLLEAIESCLLTLNEKNIIIKQCALQNKELSDELNGIGCNELKNQKLELSQLEMKLSQVIQSIISCAEIIHPDSINDLVISNASASSSTNLCSFLTKDKKIFTKLVSNIVLGNETIPNVNSSSANNIESSTLQYEQDDDLYESTKRQKIIHGSDRDASIRKTETSTDQSTFMQISFGDLKNNSNYRLYNNNNKNKNDNQSHQSERIGTSFISTPVTNIHEKSGKDEILSNYGTFSTSSSKTVSKPLEVCNSNSEESENLASSPNIILLNETIEKQAITIDHGSVYQIHTKKLNFSDSSSITSSKDNDNTELHNIQGSGLNLEPSQILAHSPHILDTSCLPKYTDDTEISPL